MKKNYFFTILLCAFAFTSQAQIIDDDFESYSTGPLLPTAHWSNWSQNPAPANSAENITISTNFANSGTNSGLINVGAATGGPQDALLLLGNLNSGLYTLSFNMYVPAGKEGYFNIQGTIPGSGALVGVFNSSDIYFNQSNTTPGFGQDVTTGTTFAFPHDTWFTVSIDFNLDIAVPTFQITINGTIVDAAPTQFQADTILGAIDFFSSSTFHTAYYDDILFDITNLSIAEFDIDSSSVYPNPVADVLHINSNVPVDTISVYNILGKRVLETKPGTISPNIDMSNLQSGVYLVKVLIGNNSKTIKVVK